MGRKPQDKINQSEQAKKDRYYYPAVFETYKDGHIRVNFVDFRDDFGVIVTSGENIEDAMHSAKKALTLHIYGLEQDGDALPFPTPLDKVLEVADSLDLITPEDIEEYGEDACVPTARTVVLVEAFMPVMREAVETKFIRKNTTLPKWLADMGEDANVNFSRVLANGLCDVLRIPEMKEKL